MAYPGFDDGGGGDTNSYTLDHPAIDAYTNGDDTGGAWAGAAGAAASDAPPAFADAGGTATAVAPWPGSAGSDYTAATDTTPAKRQTYDATASDTPPAGDDGYGPQYSGGTGPSTGYGNGDNGQASPSAADVGSWDAPTRSAPSGGLWGRASDFAGGVKDFVGDAAKSAILPERAIYDSVSNGNTPWGDPGSFVKDVYGSAAGQAKADLGYLDAAYRAGTNIGGRIQGSAAIAGNDLVQGNWGQLPDDLNPVSNAYYSVTGEQPSYMPDDQYTARQVVAQNPFGAAIPGTAGTGTGATLPDWAPFVGGRSVYNLPGDAGLARGVAAVGGAFTGDAWEQGPSIDVAALRQDLANGMSQAEAMQKYGGSIGTRTVSEMANPGNNLALPGVPKAVGEALMARNAWDQLHPDPARTPSVPYSGRKQ